jgi:5'-nucleotidase
MFRRDFIQTFGSWISVAALSRADLLIPKQKDLAKLTILHTNDTHSRIDPFPMDGGKYQGLGGVTRRKKLIDKVRAEEENVLLLDGGDFFQGTPYFNVFDGELEIKLMNQLEYEATVLGNHEFDKGVDNLVTQLEKANFKILVSNYGLDQHPLKNVTQPFHIIQKGAFKIGIVGAGINLNGLVTQKLYGDIQFLDTIEQIEYYSSILRTKHHCHFVICLSHLGYTYKDRTISDIILAKNTSQLDLIIGGHTHTFMEEPMTIRNKKNKPVVINQVGWGGISLGRLDFYFEKNQTQKCFTCKNQYVL